MHSSTRTPVIITQNAGWKYFTRLSTILDWLYHIFLPGFRHERHPDLLYSRSIWISIKDYSRELPLAAFCVRSGIDSDTQLIHKVLRRNQSYKLDLAAGNEGTRSAIIADEQVEDRFCAVTVDYEPSDNVCKVLHLWRLNTQRVSYDIIIATASPLFGILSQIPARNCIVPELPPSGAVYCACLHAERETKASWWQN